MNRKKFLKQAVKEIVARAGLPKSQAASHATYILDTISSVYHLPVSARDVAEITLEVVSRDKKVTGIAVLDWAIDKEHGGYDLAKAGEFCAPSCHYGAIVDNLLRQPEGWTSVSCVRFFSGVRYSLGDALSEAQTIANAYQADVRIYALPPDYDRVDGMFRQQFGEEGTLIVNLPHEKPEEL